MSLKKSILVCVLFMGISVKANSYPAQWALAAGGLIYLYFGAKLDYKYHSKKSFSWSIEDFEDKSKVKKIIEAQLVDKKEIQLFEKIRLKCTVPPDSTTFSLFGLLLIAASCTFSLIGNSFSSMSK